jgi:hypothetical protein
MEKGKGKGGAKLERVKREGSEGQEEWGEEGGAGERDGRGERGDRTVKGDR